MGSKTEKIVYFDAPGPQNTDEVIRLAKERADALGIKDIVVASTTGETGIKALEVFKGFNLVVVSHAIGHVSPGSQEMPEKNKARILASGAKLLTCIMAFTGIERAVKKTFGTTLPVELISSALKLFGNGIEACVEITVMAADAGLIPIDKEVIAIAGTNTGADTALVVKPANSTYFFDFYVTEIIAKPRARKEK
ncbi:MAG: pyruvate kinase alpha/beta domain-containing protein [Nitrososphaerales archaeon]